MDDKQIKKQQLSIVDGQLIACILYVVSLFISILIILDQRDKVNGNKGFLTNDEAQSLALFNKILVLILSIWFLYLDFKSRNLALNTNQDTSSLELQIIGSFISLIPAFIGLYVVATDFSNSNFQTAEIENPEI